MSSGFIESIEANLKNPLFTDNDLKMLFGEKDSQKIYNLLSYHLKKNNLIRYRRGLYSLAFRKGRFFEFSKFKLANKLVNHSFVSFESSLSHYGLIPEAVYEITSVCLQKSVTFSNHLGIFSFAHIAVGPFYKGVFYDEELGVRIANPVRALFDLVYLRRKLYSRLENLEDDLRIDMGEFKYWVSNFELSEIMEMGEYYKKKTTRTLAKTLAQMLERD